MTKLTTEDCTGEDTSFEGLSFAERALRRPNIVNKGSEKRYEVLNLYTSNVFERLFSIAGYSLRFKTIYWIHMLHKIIAFFLFATLMPEVQTVQNFPIP